MKIKLIGALLLSGFTVFAIWDVVSSDYFGPNARQQAENDLALSEAAAKGMQDCGAAKLASLMSAGIHDNQKTADQRELERAQHCNPN